ncbi:unnamed protein product [Notodromas monacha]|uniref:Uncharacterized protein n=1 Tax=Notodromas monacha TaxID=399045 RepID=A0A7R9BWC0_9CRUS|nr:unnamed protein product [Notodromas monacha]CAG0921599.1 unnamed protein product [Notodromas monacha]
MVIKNLEYHELQDNELHSPENMDMDEEDGFVRALGSALNRRDVSPAVAESIVNVFAGLVDPRVALGDAVDGGLPSKQAMSVLTSALVDHLGSPKASSAAIIQVLRCLVMVSRSDLGLYHFVKSWKRKPSAVTQLLDRLATSFSGDNSDDVTMLSTVLELIRMVRHTDSDDDPEFRAVSCRRTLRLPDVDVRKLVWSSWTEDPHPLRTLDARLGAETKSDEGCVARLRAGVAAVLANFDAVAAASVSSGVGVGSGGGSEGADTDVVMPEENGSGDWREPEMAARVPLARVLASRQCVVVPTTTTDADNTNEDDEQDDGGDGDSVELFAPMMFTEHAPRDEDVDLVSTDLLDVVTACEVGSGGSGASNNSGAVVVRELAQFVSRAAFGCPAVAAWHRAKESRRRRREEGGASAAAPTQRGGGGNGGGGGGGGGKKRDGRAARKSYVRERGSSGSGRDSFRSRPPNTSRPPSMHVDDFVALESQGHQPTGPTGYNPMSKKALRDLFKNRGRGSRVASGHDVGSPYYSAVSGKARATPPWGSSGGGRKESRGRRINR